MIPLRICKHFLACIPDQGESHSLEILAEKQYYQYYQLLSTAAIIIASTPIKLHNSMFKET
jgi:hypothetical protein